MIEPRIKLRTSFTLWSNRLYSVVFGNGFLIYPCNRLAWWSLRIDLIKMVWFHHFVVLENAPPLPDCQKKKKNQKRKIVNFSQMICNQHVTVYIFSMKCQWQWPFCPIVLLVHLSGKLKRVFQKSWSLVVSDRNFMFHMHISCHIIWPFLWYFFNLVTLALEFNLNQRKLI